jgi:hypothetical protein
MSVDTDRAKCGCRDLDHVALPPTGQFIRTSGLSDLCSTVAGMVTLKGSMSTEGEILLVSVLPYRFSICPPLVTLPMPIL